MATTVRKDTTYKGEPTLVIETDGQGHDICIEILPSGCVSLVQDGHGGYQCCSSHNTYFQMTREQMTLLHDFLGSVL